MITPGFYWVKFTKKWAETNWHPNPQYVLYCDFVEGLKEEGVSEFFGAPIPKEINHEWVDDPDGESTIMYYDTDDCWYTFGSEITANPALFKILYGPLHANDK